MIYGVRVEGKLYVRTSEFCFIPLAQYAEYVESIKLDKCEV